jgi:hypothetical protein
MKLSFALRDVCQPPLGKTIRRRLRQFLLGKIALVPERDFSAVQSSPHLTIQSWRRIVSRAFAPAKAGDMRAQGPTSRMTRRFLWTVALTVLVPLALLCRLRVAFGWGHEGHIVIALIAEKHMNGDAMAKAGYLLDGSAIDGIASWADEFRRDHPETGPWHYIDIPLDDSRIDMARECPQDQCVIGQTEHFAVLKDPKADKAARAEALKFVVHFVGDLHQSLQDEDDGDKGGNARHVIFDAKPDNLHWVWDTGLLEHISRNPEALAAELDRRITPQERADYDSAYARLYTCKGNVIRRPKCSEKWVVSLPRPCPWNWWMLRLKCRRFRRLPRTKAS